MERGSAKERIERLLAKSRTRANTEWDLIRASNIVPAEAKAALESLVSEQRVFVFGRERRFIHIDWYNKVKEAIIGALEQFHTERPLKLGMSREELRTRLPYEVELAAYSQILQVLMTEGMVAMDGEGERVRLPGHNIRLSEAHEAIKQQIEEIYLSTGVSTPLPEDVLNKWSATDAQTAKEAFDVLVETGILIQVDEKVFFHQQTIDKARELIIQHIRSHGKLTLRDCRSLLQTSRKYMLPMLYYFDELGITLRVGDDRVLRSGG
jgi:selenocysteine-specific elongation factor